ncbi:MAG TPA: hypothetical protein VIP29_08225 [Nitrososphaeraceae archaeon]
MDKSERKMFDEMMSYSRLHDVAGVGACKPGFIPPNQGATFIPTKSGFLSIHSLVR